MRIKTPCPRCDVFIETELDDEGYGVCPACENSFYLPEYRASKPIMREAALKTRVSILEIENTALKRQLAEAEAFIDQMVEANGGRWHHYLRDEAKWMACLRIYNKKRDPK